MGFDVEKLISDIAKRADTRVREGDFIQDGILYCGKCKRARETILVLDSGKEMKVHCICECDEIAEREAKERLERMERKARMQVLSPISLMNSSYREITFDVFEETPDNAKNLKLCRRYVEAFPKMLKDNQGLLMYGGVGTGKSYASACIANELIKKGYFVVMTSFVKILEAIHKGDISEVELMHRLNDAELLIIDDLEAERNTDYALEKVYNIIDSRYHKGLPMILTTNLTLNEMRDEKDIRYMRVYDRVIETCYPMHFTGMSWRRKTANARYRDFTKI